MLFNKLTCHLVFAVLLVAGTRLRCDPRNRSCNTSPVGAR